MAPALIYIADSSATATAVVVWVSDAVTAGPQVRAGYDLFGHPYPIPDWRTHYEPKEPPDPIFAEIAREFLERKRNPRNRRPDPSARAAATTKGTGKPKWLRWLTLRRGGAG